jgi:iron-sulfur cluster assembly protein
MPIPFEVTEQAAGRLKELATKVGVVEPLLRIRVVSGGCAGMEYRMDMQSTPPTAKDVVWDFGNGIRVVTDPMTALYILNSKLVWAETIMKSGFTIENPNVRAKCACGESFTV